MELIKNLSGKVLTRQIAAKDDIKSKRFVRNMLLEIGDDISNSDFSNIHYKIKNTAPLPISLSSLIYSEVGNHPFCVNILPINDKNSSVIITSRDEKQDVEDTLMKMCFYSDIERFVNIVSFCESGELCLNPDWYEKNISENKDEVKKYVSSSPDVTPQFWEKMLKIIKIN